MAVGVQMVFKEGTLDQYDQTMEKMALNEPPSGLLFHWVGPYEGGIRVTDVWESQEAFEAFAQERIMPATQEVGVAGAPEIQFFEVHNVLKGA